MTIFNKTKFKFNISLMCILGFAACSSKIPQSDLPVGANPQEELIKLDSDLVNGDINHFSILAAEDFKMAKLHEQKAAEKIKQNTDRDEQLKELRIARGYLDRAKTRALENRSKLEPIVEIRELVIGTGALQYPNTRAHLDEVDQKANRVANQSESPSPRQIQDIQRAYDGVQLETLETIHLSGVKNLIEDAKERGAEKRAPKTLKQAEVDYVNAKNALFVHRTNPDAYREPVRRAIWTAQTLSEVMDIADRDGGNFNESDAVRIVWQERQIEALKDSE